MPEKKSRTSQPVRGIEPRSSQLQVTGTHLTTTIFKLHTARKLQVVTGS